jgi:hypothetical protein
MILPPVFFVKVKIKAGKLIYFFSYFSVVKSMPYPVFLELFPLIFVIPYVNIIQVREVQMSTKKLLLTVCLLLFCPALALPAAGPSKTARASLEKERNSYYNEISAAFGFTKSDIAAVRKSDFSPDFSLVLLSIAKKAGVGVDKIIALRTDKGYSWKDMCDEYNVDYRALMASIEKVLIDNKIVPPMSTEDEFKRSAASNHRLKEGGKK